MHIATIVVLAALGVGLNVALAETASEERAIRAAENIGYSAVRVESKSVAFGSLSGCSTDDNVQFRVSGVAQDGTRREIKVCGTVPLGGYTVRT
jgi:hypothetical protein